MKRLFSLLPVAMLAALVALLAACGSSSATTSSASTTATPTTTTACLSVTTGTIQSVSNNTLQVTNLQGKNVQVTVTGATTFTRQATLTAADLKTGLPVTVVVKQNPDNTYSALTVGVRTSLTRQGGTGNSSGAKLCSGHNSLTVTDTSGNDFTVTLTATTRMTEQQSATASDLQIGQVVAITGTANSQGVINASSVSLLQALPTRRRTPTPTPTTSNT